MQGLTLPAHYRSMLSSLEREMLAKVNRGPNMCMQGGGGGGG